MTAPCARCGDSGYVTHSDRSEVWCDCPARPFIGGPQIPIRVLTDAELGLCRRLYNIANPGLGWAPNPVRTPTAPPPATPAPRRDHVAQAEAMLARVRADRQKS